jgi:hypothetical protein
MTDGASKTLVLCETRETERSNWYDPQQGFVCGFLPSDTQPIDEQKTQYYPYFKQSTPPEWVFNPKSVDRTALEYGPTESDAGRAYHAAPGDPLARKWGPSAGYSTGITHHCSADSSVHGLPADTDPKVYYSMISANGGEILDLPETLIPPNAQQ